MLEDVKKVLAGIRKDTEKVIRKLTENHIRCERYDVTTAPNGSVIGVTQPFGTEELFIPYSWMCSNAAVGDTVIVVWWNGLSNAQAWFKGGGWAEHLLSLTPAGNGLVVNGSLTANTIDLVNRRTDKSIAGVGWYRVMKYAATSAAEATGNHTITVDFVLEDQTRQYHRISLFINYTSMKFDREFTVSSLSYIDKIRYTTNGSDGYVDIHFTSTGARHVAVWFDVQCNRADWIDKFTPQPFTAVADAPTGETIQTTFTLSTGSNTVNQKAGNIWLYTDSEGGNIRMLPTSGTTYGGDTVNYWETDAYNGALRFIANRTPSGGSATNAFPLTMTPKGSVMGAVLGLWQAKSALASNANLNDYTTPGVYAVETNVIAATLTSTPNSLPTALAGTLRVWNGIGSATAPGESYYYVVQEYTNYYTDTWRRKGESGSGTTVTWSSWNKITNNVQSTTTFSISYGGRTATAYLTKVGNTVQLYASIGNGTAFSGLAGIDSIGTIPAGYRPLDYSWTSVSARDTGTWASANYTTALLYVQPNGSVEIRGNTSVMQTMKYILFTATWVTA